MHCRPAILLWLLVAWAGVTAAEQDAGTSFPGQAVAIEPPLRFRSLTEGMERLIGALPSDGPRPDWIAPVALRALAFDEVISLRAERRPLGEVIATALSAAGLQHRIVEAKIFVSRPIDGDALSAGLRSAEEADRRAALEMALASGEPEALRQVFTAHAPQPDLVAEVLQSYYAEWRESLAAREVCTPIRQLDGDAAVAAVVDTLLVDHPLPQAAIGGRPQFCWQLDLLADVRPPKYLAGLHERLQLKAIKTRSSLWDRMLGDPVSYMVDSSFVPVVDCLGRWGDQGSLKILQDIQRRVIDKLDAHHAFDPCVALVGARARYGDLAAFQATCQLAWSRHARPPFVSWSRCLRRPADLEPMLLWAYRQPHMAEGHDLHWYSLPALRTDAGLRWLADYFAVDPDDHLRRGLIQLAAIPGNDRSLPLFDRIIQVPDEPAGEKERRRYFSSRMALIDQVWRQLLLIDTSASRRLLSASLRAWEAVLDHACLRPRLVARLAQRGEPDCVLWLVAGWRQRADRTIGQLLMSEPTEQAVVLADAASDDERRRSVALGVLGEHGDPAHLRLIVDGLSGPPEVAETAAGALANFADQAVPLWPDWDIELRARFFDGLDWQELSVVTHAAFLAHLATALRSESDVEGRVALAGFKSLLNHGAQALVEQGDEKIGEMIDLALEHRQLAIRLCAMQHVLFHAEHYQTSPQRIERAIDCWLAAADIPRTGDLDTRQDERFRYLDEVYGRKMDRIVLLSNMQRWLKGDDGRMARMVGSQGIIAPVRTKIGQAFLQALAKRPVHVDVGAFVPYWKAPGDWGYDPVWFGSLKQALRQAVPHMADRRMQEEWSEALGVPVVPAMDVEKAGGEGF